MSEVASEYKYSSALCAHEMHLKLSMKASSAADSLHRVSEVGGGMGVRIEGGEAVGGCGDDSTTGSSTESHSAETPDDQEQGTVECMNDVDGGQHSGAGTAEGAVVDVTNGGSGAATAFSPTQAAKQFYSSNPSSLGMTGLVPSSLSQQQQQQAYYGSMGQFSGELVYNGRVGVVTVGLEGVFKKSLGF